MRKEMQTLLDDIELDIQELKYLMQTITAEPDSKLRIVAKRSIQQMRARLDELQKVIEPVEIKAPEVTEPVSPKHEPEAAPISSSASPILAERIKPATDLRHAISLNDSFRFAREIFGGNTARMNEVIRQLGDAPSLDKALELFSSLVNPDEENEAVVDFVELLKKYFS
ncbi:hypothetical protein [Bacteroides oleiciplenus]|uniref:hypothetical protein n=1 Tax=Bacteroides oleiciplenus TaxID=626931 RepID=UPI0026DC1EC1|nr:hypothetical protein [Bacteroides oleiciplenus]